jgi:hypothetical protein
MKQGVDVSKAFLILIVNVRMWLTRTVTLPNSAVIPANPKRSLCK